MNSYNKALGHSALQRLFNEGTVSNRDFIRECAHNHLEVDRPDWDNYFMEIAKVAAKRSFDVQTSVGAVIVNDKNQVLGMGYNGPVSGINDKYIPNVRPQKYPFMIHAELNACLNCPDKPIGGKVYVTMRPCTNCLQIMAQYGISEIVYIDNRTKMCQNENEENMFSMLVALLENKMKVRVLKE